MHEIDNDLKRPKFKSPLPKLVKFFEKSRGKWKAKYMEVKYKEKLLSNQIRYLKGQNAKLKQRIKGLENELGESSEKKTLQ